MSMRGSCRAPASGAPRKTLEQKARLAAKRIGLIARRTNVGGFTLLDTRSDCRGARELTPKEIIDLCTAAFNYGVSDDLR